MRSPTQSNSVITIEFRSAIPGSEKRMELFLEQVSRQAGTSVRADKKAFLRSESASRPGKCKPFRITFPQQQRGHPQIFKHC